ncbi:unnamed protein product [Nippostrongylus brasiliensis]|uniref:Protein sprint (inferred by orthology to a D. melanogaster protein) n=1 Tax=Nippostrongylus brasiliensis TaxID=27835 RepID=A0A0N4YN30_NIPBR|nr:unnamed protein product [Nippostrongylus brasiliensis]
MEVSYVGVRPTLQSRAPPSTMTVDGVCVAGAKNSDYAQLGEFNGLEVPKPDMKRDDDNVSVAGTVFNEPWDSNVWENLLDLASHGDEGLSPRSRRLSEAIQEEDSDSDRTPGGSTRMHESDDELDDEMWASTTSARRTLPSDRVTCKAWENDEISNYGTIDSHDSMSGTLRKSERRGQTPPHSMHSFNYCTCSGDLHALIDQESAHLNANQILNIDAILEAVLHKLLLKRVKPHLYHVMVKEHSRAGGLQALSANIAYVRGLTLSELGFHDAKQLVTPSTAVMEQVKNCLRKMQHHYSPLKKLENLLRAISIVLSVQNTSDENKSQKTLAADDLVRWMVYILARSSTGDAAYYLTALFSAIHILKSIDAIKKLAEKDEDMVSSMDLSRQFYSPSPSCASDAFVKVAIPDEFRYATFPGVPQMTTGKLCRVIAHQQGITNPEDHGL